MSWKKRYTKTRPIEPATSPAYLLTGRFGACEPVASSQLYSNGDTVLGAPYKRRFAMGGKNVERRLLTPDTDLRHRGAGRLCATGHSYLLAVANPADRIGDGSGVVSTRVGRPKRPRIRLRSGTGCLSPMVRQSAISPSAAASSVISPRGPTISRYSPLASLPLSRPPSNWRQERRPISKPSGSPAGRSATPRRILVSHPILSPF